MSHTKGPWDLGYTPETGFYVSADGPIVSGIKNEADAALISAAPDLLQTIERIKQIVILGVWDHTDSPACVCLDEIRVLANEAIAKVGSKKK